MRSQLEVTEMFGCKVNPTAHFFFFSEKNLVGLYACLVMVGQPQVRVLGFLITMTRTEAR